MQRPSILILPFHGIGHFNAFFGIARALQKTHDVVFAGDAYFHNHVAARHFPYISLTSYPFGIGLEGWINETRKARFPRLKTIADRWKDTLYHGRKAELTKLLRDLQPVHVLIDAQQATDVVVIKAIDPELPVSVISATPPYLVIPGLPPINSLAMPGDDSDCDSTLGAIKAKVWRQRMKYFGMDDRAMVTRRLRRNKMQQLKDIYPSLITLAIKDIDRYVLTYKEFDFHHDHFKSYRYIGPHFDLAYQEPEAEEFSKRIGDIKVQGKKLVYCSFGTVPSGKNMEGFLSRLNDAISDLDCVLIAGTSREWVPQSTVLGQADVFITHGGINSVHDAIRFKVPMLVYPTDPNYDQNGNSSRVLYHELGLRGNFDTDTAQDIRKKLIDLFSDIRFKKNLDAFQSYSYPVENFIQMLQL